jgi:hypothetical protein
MIMAMTESVKRRQIAVVLFDGFELLDVFGPLASIHRFDPDEARVTPLPWLFRPGR